MAGPTAQESHLIDVYREAGKAVVHTLTIAAKKSRESVLAHKIAYRSNPCRLPWTRGVPPE